MAKILNAFLICMLVATPLFCDEAADQQKKLAKLKNEKAQKEKELQKYKEQEKKISKEISALESKKARTQQLKNKVESDISIVEQNLLSTEEKRAALERSMPLWQGIAMEEMANFYFTPSCPACPGGYSLEQQIFIERMLTHKAAFAAEIHKQTDEAKERIHAFEERNKKLLAQSSQIKAEQEVLSKSFNQKKQDFNANQRKMKALRKEIDELGKSAQALNNWLDSYARKSNAGSGGGKNKKYEGPKINLPEHSLPWPVKGKVISPFGKEYRADLNTWIFRDGIKIAAAYGTPVRAVMEGSVIYAGPFRSYGNVVIMDHGKGIFTIYGFLKDIQAAVGTKLAAQGVLGTAGKDTQASSGTGQSAVYFEIRQGTTAVDPEQWLK